MPAEQPSAQSWMSVPVSADFLERLAARALGLGSFVRPGVTSPYERLPPHRHRETRRDGFVGFDDEAETRPDHWDPLDVPRSTRQQRAASPEAGESADRRAPMRRTVASTSVVVEPSSTTPRGDRVRRARGVPSPTAFPPAARAVETGATPAPPPPVAGFGRQVPPISLESYRRGHDLS